MSIRAVTASVRGSRRNTCRACRLPNQTAPPPTATSTFVKFPRRTIAARSTIRIVLGSIRVTKPVSMSPSQTEPSPTASESSPGVSMRPVIRRVFGSRRESVSLMPQSVNHTSPSPTPRSVTISPDETVVRATTRPAVGSTLTTTLLPTSLPSTHTAPSPTATAIGSEIPSGIRGGNAPLDSPTSVRKPRPPEVLTTQAISPSAAITEGESAETVPSIRTVRSTAAVFRSICETVPSEVFTTQIQRGALEIGPGSRPVGTTSVSRAVVASSFATEFGASTGGGSSGPRARTTASTAATPPSAASAAPAAASVVLLLRGRTERVNPRACSASATSSRAVPVRSSASFARALANTASMSAGSVGFRAAAEGAGSFRWPHKTDIRESALNGGAPVRHS
jgi:hypothetical protein